MKREIIVILNNIRSRENVGSIFRTADAAGVSRLYLCGITPVPSASGGATGQAPQHDKIAKTALGAENYVPWSYIRNTGQIVTKLKKEGIQVVALEQTKDAENIFQLGSLASKLALILGNEVNGISPALLKKCDKKISIPMYGKKESLNVSVAFGVAVFQLIK